MFIDMLPGLPLPLRDSCSGFYPKLQSRPASAIWVSLLGAYSFGNVNSDSTTFEASRRFRFGSLRTILRTWLGLCRSAGHSSHPSNKWLKLMDFKLALLSHHIGQVQPILQDLIRRDDNIYYQALADRAGRISTEEGFQGLWKELRGVLPKWRKRGVAQRFDIDDALCQHFAKLEAGHTSNLCRPLSWMCGISEPSHQCHPTASTAAAGGTPHSAWSRMSMQKDHTRASTGSWFHCSWSMQDWGCQHF